MLAVFNQYSFVLLIASAGLILAGVLWRWRALHRLVRLGLLVAYLALALIWALTSRYPPELAPQTTAEVEAVLDNGQATFLMLYSNY